MMDMLEFTKKILASYYQDECEVYAVYGMPEGIGKSALTLKTFTEIKSRPKPIGQNEHWDWNYELVKPLVKFYPRDVVLLCKDMTDRNKRHEGFIWDDAGLWLNAMEWHDPFVIAFTKYLNIARTNWAAIVLTTPVLEWVLKKVRSSEGLISVKITKVKGHKTYRGKIREAKAYRKWVHPDRKHHGVATVFSDVFDAMLPDPFYDWYKPIRDRYAAEAVTQMFKSLEEKKGLGWDVSRDEVALEEVKEHINKANDVSGDLDEAIDSLPELP